MLPDHFSKPTKTLILSLVLCLAPAVASGRMIQWDPPLDGRGARAPVQLKSGELLAVRSATQGERVQMIVAASRDDGKTWSDVGVIASDVRGTDLGDQHLITTLDDRLLCSYRRNHLHGEGGPTYAIEVAQSVDDGRTWTRHSVVAQSRPDTGREPSRGLWSSFLLQRRDGTLQCYYDDEETPFGAGFPRHQWLSMRTWDAKCGQWLDPVTVSRAHDENHLSRDGMPSVVELDGGRLIAAFESVQVRPPHANLVRYVTSDDGGRTWSWREAERGVLYQPARGGDFMALAPWMIRLHDDQTLLCVFCTDEDRERPDVSGTPPHRLNMDVKYVSSTDGGRTWDRDATLVYAGGHRNYLPGVAQLHRGGVMVQLLDYTRGYRVVSGRME